MSPKTRLALALASAALIVSTAALSVYVPAPHATTAAGDATSLARGQEPDTVLLQGPGAVAGARARVRPDVPDGGGYGAPRGRRFVFAADGTLASGLEASTAEAPAGPGQELAVAWRTRLRVHVADRRADQLLVWMGLEDFELRPRGDLQPDDPARLAALAEQLGAESVLIKMGVDGQTRGLRFPDGMDAEARQWVRTLVAAFRFVIPAEAAHVEAWEAHEVDTTGRARVQYRWRGPARELDGARELDRHKLGYDADSISGGRAEVDGRGSASWSALMGWIEAADVFDGLRLEVPELGLIVRYAFQGRLRLESWEDAPPDAAAAQWQGPWESVGGGEREAGFAADLERERRRDALGGATLDQLVGELAAALAEHGIESFEVFAAASRLAWHLELEPGEALALEELVLAGGLAEEAAALALAALGQAATSEAQVVLARILGDVAQNEALRVAALHSAFQLGAPDEIVLSSVLSVLHAGAPNEVHGTALLLLGHLASGTGTGDDALAEILLGELLAMEGSAQASGSGEVWLAAVGNACAPSSLPQILPYLSTPAVELRSAAVAALRGIETAQATDALVSAARHDPVAAIRADAVRIVGLRDAPAALDAVCQIARDDPDETVRREGVLALGVGPGAGTLGQQTLAWCAHHDPSAEVQELAAAILAAH